MDQVITERMTRLEKKHATYRQQMAKETVEELEQLEKVMARVHAILKDLKNMAMCTETTEKNITYAYKSASRCIDYVAIVRDMVEQEHGI